MTVKTVALACAIYFICTPAHAYIDPGAASLILQAVIGFIAAAGLFFRTHIMNAFMALKKFGKSPKGSSPDDDDD